MPTGWLGLGHVTGAVPVVWTPSLDAVSLELHGLVVDESGQKTDLVLRVPRHPESLFRGVVQLDSSLLHRWVDEALGQPLGDLLALDRGKTESFQPAGQTQPSAR